MSLAFLKNITIGDPDTMKKTRAGGGGARKAWNPSEELKAIRVWKDGSIFPSKALVDWFDLEYRAKDADHQGNGLDIFRSAQFPIFNSPQALILINVVDKAKGKIDAFGTVGYIAEATEEKLQEGEPGDPLNSVMDQGSMTFGKDDLLPMIKEVYDIEPNEKGFIDLILIGADGEDAVEPFQLPDGKKVCPVPKLVSRGPKKGEMTYVRRENPRLYALYPYDLAHPTEETTQE